MTTQTDPGDRAAAYRPDARPVPVTVTYWAISVLNSKTVQANVVFFLTAVIPLLALPEVLAAIPPRYLLAFTALVAMANGWLRLQTERPVAFIPLGTTTPVEVKKIGPPPPTPTTD